jgi:AcrR family transcriptional regulator
MNAIPQGGLRERKKTATRAAIQEQAMRLFLQQGYEATTVEEIAAAAGVSHMTFFRYFPSKEDAVMADEYDPFIAEMIAARPAIEPDVVKVQRALRASIDRIGTEEQAFVLARAQLIFRTPALRARLWDQERATRDLIVEALSTGNSDRTRMQVVAAACVATMSTGVEMWAEGNGSRSLADILDDLFEHLQDAFDRNDDV